MFSTTFLLGLGTIMGRGLRNNNPWNSSLSSSSGNLLSLLIPMSSWLSRGKKYKLRTLSSLKLRFRYNALADTYVRRKANLGHFNLKKSHGRIQRLTTPTFTTLKQANRIKKYIGTKGNRI